MSDKFQELLTMAGRKEITPDAFVAALKTMDALSAKQWVAESLSKFDPIRDKSIVRCLLKSAYEFRSETFGSSLVKLLDRFWGYPDFQLFEVASDLEFVYTILGVLKTVTAVGVLQRFAERVVDWDDLFGVNRSAVYAIANIGGDSALAALKQLSMNEIEEIAVAAKKLLEKKH